MQLELVNMDAEPVCDVDGCERPEATRGWCTAHYARWLTHGDVQADQPVQPYMDQVPPCAVEGCDRRHYARGWCDGHYSRWNKHGDVRAEVPLAVHGRSRRPSDRAGS